MALKIIQNSKSASLKDALYVLRFSLQDVRTRSSLIDLNLINVLQNMLSEQLSDPNFNPTFFSSDLFGCLKILVQCDESCRQKIYNDHTTLLKLLEGKF